MAGSRPRIRLEGGGGEPVTLFPGPLGREKSPGPLSQRQAGRRGYGRGYGRVWVDGVFVHPGPRAHPMGLRRKKWQLRLRKIRIPSRLFGVGRARIFV